MLFLSFVGSVGSIAFPINLSPCRPSILKDFEDNSPRFHKFVDNMMSDYNPAFMFYLVRVGIKNSENIGALYNTAVLFVK